MANLPSIDITYQISKKTETRTLETTYGGGYRQRAGDGINQIIDGWSLTWTVNSTDADTLTDFFEARKGYESFDWIPSGESVSKKWTCKSWSKVPAAAKDASDEEVWNISATFRQEFDLIGE